MNIAFIGLGTHAIRGHYDYLKNLDGVQIIGAHDLNSQSCLKLGIDYYKTLEELLADKNVEAVLDCSPDRFHTDHLERIISAGKHAFVEKPLAESSKDLAKLINVFASAKNQGLVLQSCHPRRFDPPYVWLKKRLPDFTKQLGDVKNVRLDFFYNQLSKEDIHHGLLIDHINHEIDTINYLFGFKDFWAKKISDSQESYQAVGSRDNDFSFFFSGSRNLTNNKYLETVEIIFQKGVIRLDTESGKTELIDYDTGERKTFNSGQIDYEQRFSTLNQNFVDAIQGKSEPYLSEAEMLVNTKLGIYLTETGDFRS